MESINMKSYFNFRIGGAIIQKGHLSFIRAASLSLDSSWPKIYSLF